MDTYQNLMMGLSLVLTPQNLLFAFLGCLVGTLVGVLPGLGPPAATAMLIPLTLQLPALGSIVMLSAIYYGAMYGGTVTSVLMNVPGETSSVVTCLDGHPMARQGRAGVALSIAAIGSFIGGTIATIVLIIAALPLARLSLLLGPPEQFSLIVLGLSLFTWLAGKSMVQTLMIAILGLLLALIGMDPAQGAPRFTFGQAELLDGLDLVPVVMGLFGLGDILANAEGPMQQGLESKVKSLIPTLKDVRDSAWPVMRGSAVGIGLGLIPGMTGSLSSFMSYALERKSSKHPEKFGTGMIEGVAGPETANNAHANAALIPLFTLGIPGSATIAILMGAFMMNGLTPGPLLFREHPDIAWGVIASLLVGNVMLLILNLPLIGIWVSILKIPYSILFPLILVFMLVGSYSVNNSLFDVRIMLVFGLLGYVLKKLDFAIAPFALTFILAVPMERSLRQSLLMSQGDFSILVTRPASAFLLTLVMIILLLPALRLLPFGISAVRGRTDG